MVRQAEFNIQVYFTHLNHHIRLVEDLKSWSKCVPSPSARTLLMYNVKSLNTF